MDAPGALDSFLGRLTTVLVNEAQLLGGVRSDVEFIKDEMESMNGLIRHLTEAQHRDHQVRAWMKQVVGLTRDCEGNVELYVHYVGSRPGDHGLLGFLRRIARFLLTMPVRHRIAMRIRELKVRARDVGDRRQRYGVTVPESTITDLNNSAVDVELGREEELGDLRRCAVLLDAAESAANYSFGREEELGDLGRVREYEDSVKRISDTLMKCLTTEPATTQDGVPPPQVRVFSVVCNRYHHRYGPSFAYHIAETAHQHPSLATSFSCRARSELSDGKEARTVHAEVLEQISGGVQVQVGHGQEEELANEPGLADEDSEEQLISKIQANLEGVRFFILVNAVDTDELASKHVLDALLHAADGCLPGSAIVMFTSSRDLALSCAPSKVIEARSQFIFPRKVLDFYMRKALYPRSTIDDILSEKIEKTITYIFYPRLCHPNTFATKTFLHLLYVNPNMTTDELEKYVNDISECRRLKRSIPKQVLMWCYKELPSQFRSCLLYLSIFPQGHVIRTTSLARRLIAEGLITAPTSSAASYVIQSSTDEAERYLDVLFIRGFVTPREISAAGNIKSFVVHPEVQDFIARVARDVNFVDTDQPISFTHRLSINNRIGWQTSTADVDSKDIAAYLPALAASPQWQLLKVLDLEGCKGLNKKHMKSICKILLLKYLSLRNTDVTELPKQMKDLQYLETLDIRQTKVQMLAKKSIVLPLLKHFLAGHKISDSNRTRTSRESFSAVELSLGIHKMKNMEILSHVKVTDSDSELTGIAQLLKLRKLGVALHGKCTMLSDLFSQIEKLHRCLRALSIWIDPMAAPDNHDAGIEDALPSLPKFIERLNISGISNGISNLIEEQHQLIKITLSETYIKEDDLQLLGKLKGLCCLRLQHNSYSDSELALKEDEFKSLKYLLVKGSSITRISFVEGAAPELGRIVWSFDRMDALSGTKHLSNLKEVQLNGDCIYFGHTLMKHPDHQEVNHNNSDPLNAKMELLQHQSPPHPHQIHQYCLLLSCGACSDASGLVVV